MWEHAKLLWLFLTLCNPVDCSLPGFSIHGIFQGRLLEWVAISFSRGTWISNPGIEPGCPVSVELAGRILCLMNRWGSPPALG